MAEIYMPRYSNRRGHFKSVTNMLFLSASFLSYLTQPPKHHPTSHKAERREAERARTSSIQPQQHHLQTSAANILSLSVLPLSISMQHPAAQKRRNRNRKDKSFTHPIVAAYPQPTEAVLLSVSFLSIFMQPVTHSPR